MLYPLCVILSKGLDFGNSIVETLTLSNGPKLEWIGPRLYKGLAFTKGVRRATRCYL